MCKATSASVRMMCTLDAILDAIRNLKGRKCKNLEDMEIMKKPLEMSVEQVRKT